jgi:hypothetical protein
LITVGLGIIKSKGVRVVNRLLTGYLPDSTPLTMFSVHGLAGDILLSDWRCHKLPVLDEVLLTQIERILHSEALRGSEAQRSLLKFLGEKSLTGEADQLKEYSVGVDALGRPPTYDPRRDSSVRVQMGRLRQKLTEYYQTEGKSDSILIEVPKGHFKLIWHPRPEPPPPRQENGASRETMLLRYTAGVTAAAVLILAAWSVHLKLQLSEERKETSVFHSQWTPELDALWAPFLNTERPLVVSLGVPLFVEIPKFGYFRDKSVNRKEDVAGSQTLDTIRKALKADAVQPRYIYSLSGNANVGFMLGSLLATRKSNVSLSTGGELSWRQISENNVVIVGSQKFFEQSLERLPVSPELIIESGVGIRNLHPRNGEPATFSDYDPADGSEGVTWALISHQAGPRGIGEIRSFQSRINGGIIAAVQWFTEPASARTLFNKIKTASAGFPRYYQILLKVRFQGAVPLETSFVLYRELH